MQLFEFRLPDIGEGVAEGEIVEWKVREGDSVQEDQVLLEVMTDKATVEISSPVRGTIAKIVAAAGTVVPVGAILVTILPAEGAHVPTIATHGEHGGGHEAAAAPAAEAQTVEVAAAPQAEPDFVRPAGQRALATPYTRRLAREAGVDIEKIRGTGEADRVVPEDVERYAASRTAPAAKAAAAPVAAPAAAAAPEAAPAPTSISEQVAAKAAAPAVAPAPAVSAPVLAPLPVLPGARETRIPIRGVRKKISERMHQSKTTAAHFTYVEEVDVTDLVELRADLKEAAAKRGVKLTYLPFILKAIVSGLRAFPTLNGVTDDARQEFVVKHYFNFGIAVDTDDGLMVPVVKDVDRRSLVELAAEIDRIATDARNGKAKLDDLKDGTFTITNAGNIGGLFATPVINYPEAAIVGVHAIRQRPWIVGGEIKVRDIMYLSISIDHRMNDGATGARFMNHVVALLTDPRRLLLEI